jgi:Spy/CpxP family protein refolding chaperone
MNREVGKQAAVAGRLLVASLALAGCAQNAAGESVSTTPAAIAATGGTPEDVQAAEEVRDHHRHHHHGGVTMFVAMSLDMLGLPPEEKDKVEKIRADLHAKMAPARDAEHALLQVLADGIAAGAIDDAKVNDALAQVATATAAVHAASIEALNQLHAALTGPERRALVDKTHAHWHVWRQVHDEHPASREKGSHLTALAERLQLTPEQVEQIARALPAAPPVDHAPVENHLQAFATAFESETFDAATLTTADPANAHIGKRGSERLVGFYKAVVPVLTPEQRQKLAAHLQERLDDRHETATAAN